MRDREVIKENFANADFYQSFDYILEVLLDIRDLLACNSGNKTSGEECNEPK